MATPTDRPESVRITPENLNALYVMFYGEREAALRQADVAAHGVEAALLKAEARAKQSAKSAK